ncbi:MAG: AEC family transporter [Candidatus Omnitrophica bacterium]|nr:AEC family transporter [Candidatus Omnitrophota bacterium]
MEIHFTFQAIAAGMAKLFFLVLLGCAIYRLKLVDDKFIDKLTYLLVIILFPSLIISKTITHFSFTQYAYWWVLPVSAVAFSLSGMALGALVFKLFRGFGSRREFMCAVGFQNCGYLPMNLIIFSFSGLIADRLLIYMFLFISGFNLLMWSIAPLFLAGGLKRGFRWNVFLNPPVVAAVFSLLWVAVFGKGSMPELVMGPVRQLGQASFPVAMLTLGAYLCRYRAYVPENKAPIISGVVLKLLVFPLFVFMLLLLVPVSGDYRFFLFLQSTMPTAVSLIFIGSYTGADNRFFSSIIFYSHLIAVLSIPFWLGIFHLVFGT